MHQQNKLFMIDIFEYEKERERKRERQIAREIEGEKKKEKDERKRRRNVDPSHSFERIENWLGRMTRQKNTNMTREESLSLQEKKICCQNQIKRRDREREKEEKKWREKKERKKLMRESKGDHPHSCNNQSTNVDTAHQAR